MAKKSNNTNELDEILAQIEKDFGKGSIMKLGQRPQVNEDVIPSGSLLLNQGKICILVEIFLNHF